MNKDTSLAKRFEDFCAKLFTRLGDVEVPRPGRRGFDFRVYQPEKQTLVEVKLYKSKYVPTPWLWGVASRLQFACVEENVTSGILAVTCRVTPYTRQNIRRQSPSVEVYDPSELGRLAAADRELSGEFRAILREALDEVPSEFLPPEQIGGPLFAVGNVGANAEAPAPEVTIPEEVNTGDELCKELERIPEGRAGFREFEKVGEKALRYLFSDDFSFFQPQHVHDDLLRTDVVGKLAPTVDFWVGIARDFRTRYVVFEFKNYRDPITSDEIYSTERYLFTTALRSVAIVIARNGASPQAFHAAKGALRESGKLIIVVSLRDICKMLHAKDQNDDPSDTLSDALDEMLMTVTR